MNPDGPMQNRKVAGHGLAQGLFGFTDGRTKLILIVLPGADFRLAQIQ